MLDEAPLLYPYRTTPKRIADDLVTALASAPGVVAISLFGSLADGTWDGLSDVDVLVGHEGGEAVAWACAAALREAMPVRFYRMFTGVEQPSGRYWFWGESAFHQADVSFWPMAEYERVRFKGVRAGFPVVSRELLRRRTSDAPTPTAHPEHVEGRAAASPPLPISERERSVGKAVYIMLHRTKGYLRGQLEREAYDAAYRQLLEAMHGIRPDEMFAGGDLAGLAQDCFALRFAIDRAERAS